MVCVCCENRLWKHHWYEKDMSSSMKRFISVCLRFLWYFCMYFYDCMLLWKWHGGHETDWISCKPIWWAGHRIQESIVACKSFVAAGQQCLKRNWRVLCRPVETNRLWSHGYPFISHWPCNCWDAHHWLRRGMDWSQFQHCLFLMCSSTVVRAKLICLWLKLSGGTTYLLQNQD